MTTEVSSTILDLIIVLFRGNEEEGGKNPPHVRGTDNWWCQVELRHGSGAGNSCFRLIQISWAIQLALVGFLNPWTNPPFLDSALSKLKDRYERCESKSCKHTRGSPSLISIFPMPSGRALNQARIFLMKEISRFQSPRQVSASVHHGLWDCERPFASESASEAVDWCLHL